jgi:hypothetical protein
MVVVADGTLATLRDSSWAYHAIWRLGAAADVLVWTRAESDGRLPLRASLPATIVRKADSSMQPEYLRRVDTVTPSADMDAFKPPVVDDLTCIPLFYNVLQAVRELRQDRNDPG